MKIKISKLNEVPVVSSRYVAKHFDKRHNDFVRDIEKIIRELKEADVSGPEHWFKESLYRTTRNNTYTEYLMTRDGFSLIAMGLTGRKALEWKIKYIEAFNSMEDQLDYNRARSIRGKHLSSLEQFSNYSKKMGAAHASVHYATFGDNTTALKLVASSPESTEEFLDALEDMSRPTMLVAEALALNSLSEGVRNGYPVKDIYIKAMQKVIEYSAGQFKILK